MNTNENAFFVIIWIVIMLWSLARLVQLGSGALPEKVSATPIPVKIIGGIGMILAMFAFFANILVVLSLLTLLEGMEPELAAVLDQARTMYLALGNVFNTLSPVGPTPFFEKPHLIALSLVGGMLLMAEILILPATIAFNTVVARRRERALDRLEAAVKGSDKTGGGRQSGVKNASR